MRGSRSAWIAITVAVACDGQVDRVERDAGFEFRPFDVDVVVRSGVVQVWLREGFPTGCPEVVYPHPGECSGPELPSCDEPAEFCLERVALERDGIVLGQVTTVAT